MEGVVGNLYFRCLIAGGISRLTRLKAWFLGTGFHRLILLSLYRSLGRHY